MLFKFYGKKIILLLAYQSVDQRSIVVVEIYLISYLKDNFVAVIVFAKIVIMTVIIMLQPM